jgi:hypothetical protein
MPTTYRCAHCGNRTRFDVYERLERRRFMHFTLGGEAAVDEEEVLVGDTLRVVCRWCERDDAIEVVPSKD